MDFNCSNHEGAIWCCHSGKTDPFHMPVLNYHVETSARASPNWCWSSYKCISVLISESHRQTKELNLFLNFFTSYNAVMASWQLAFSWENVDFQIQDVRTRVLRDMAWVTMKAYIDLEIPYSVSNVYELHNGRWYMVHHHSSPDLIHGGGGPVLQWQGFRSRSMSISYVKC